MPDKFIEDLGRTQEGSFHSTEDKVVHVPKKLQPEAGREVRRIMTDEREVEDGKQLSPEELKTNKVERVKKGLERVSSEEQRETFRQLAALEIARDATVMLSWRYLAERLGQEKIDKAVLGATGAKNFDDIESFQTLLSIQVPGREIKVSVQALTNVTDLALRRGEEGVTQEPAKKLMPRGTKDRTKEAATPRTPQRDAQEALIALTHEQGQASLREIDAAMVLSEVVLDPDRRGGGNLGSEQGVQDYFHWKIDLEPRYNEHLVRKSAKDSKLETDAKAAGEAWRTKFHNLPIQQIIRAEERLGLLKRAGSTLAEISSALSRKDEAVQEGRQRYETESTKVLGGQEKEFAKIETGDAQKISELAERETKLEGVASELKRSLQAGALSAREVYTRFNEGILDYIRCATDAKKYLREIGYADTGYVAETIVKKRAKTLVDYQSRLSEVARMHDLPRTATDKTQQLSSLVSKEIKALPVEIYDSQVTVNRWESAKIFEQPKEPHESYQTARARTVDGRKKLEEAIAKKVPLKCVTEVEQVAWQVARDAEDAVRPYDLQIAALQKETDSLKKAITATEGDTSFFGKKKRAAEVAEKKQQLEAFETEMRRIETERSSAQRKNNSAQAWLKELQDKKRQYSAGVR